MIKSILCTLVFFAVWPGSLLLFEFLHEKKAVEQEAFCRSLGGVPVYHVRDVLSCVSSSTGFPIDMEVKP